MPPICLEEAAEGTFLETTFRVEEDRVRFRIKNGNAGGVRKVWLYHAWDSYVPEQQKRSTMVSTLKKVDCMASDDAELFESAVDKLREFADLGYPARMRRKACSVVEQEGGSHVWRLVAASQ